MSLQVIILHIGVVIISFLLAVDCDRRDVVLVREGSLPLAHRLPSVLLEVLGHNRVYAQELVLAVL